jgi:hypothetical protein
MSTNPFDFQLPILEPGHAGGSGKGFLYSAHSGASYTVRRLICNRPIGTAYCL